MNQQTSVGLSNDVRAKMIKDLADKNTGLVYVGVTVASMFLLAILVGRSAHILWGLLVGAVAGSSMAQWQEKKLLKFDDQMIQFLYDEHQRGYYFRRVLSVFGWVAIIGYLVFRYFNR